MTCEEARLALGALVLGGLDDAEAAAVRAHVDTCAGCRAEYDELRGLPRVLGLVSAASLDIDSTIAGRPVAGPAPDQAERLLVRLAEERRARRRRRITGAVAAGGSLVAAAAAAGFLIAGQATPDEAPAAADLTLEVTDDDTGVWAELALDDVGWGTRVSLELAGVPAGEHCSLVASSQGRGDETASTWTVPPDVDDYITIPGAVGAALDDIDTFTVVASDGTTLVSIPRAEWPGLTLH